MAEPPPAMAISWAATLLSSPLRPHLAGIERADSVTFDAHKWLQVPLGSGMFLTRHAEAPAAAFATDSAYMPQRPASARGDAPDNYNLSHQWSRRAAGVQLFAALATIGAAGYAEMIDRMAALGDVLRAKLTAAGFRIENETPLPLVNFTHERMRCGDTKPGDIARVLHRRGRAWISPTVLADGRAVLRACITSHLTEERDLDVLVDELRAAL